MVVSALQQHESAVYIFIYVYIPPLVSLPRTSHPTSVGHHRAPGWAPCVIQKLPTTYFADRSVCAKFNFLNPSHLLLPRWGHKSVLYICVSIPSLQIGSSVLFFQIPYICVNIWYLFFSLRLMSLCVTGSSF